MTRGIGQVRLTITYYGEQTLIILWRRRVSGPAGRWIKVEERRIAFLLHERGDTYVQHIQEAVSEIMETHLEKETRDSLWS